MCLLLAFLLDLLVHGFEPTQDLKNALESLIPESNNLDSDVAARVCLVLEIMDPMRVNYWRWRKSSLSSHVEDGVKNLSVH